MQVKMCGVTSKMDLSQIKKSGVDMIGLIFHYESLRYVGYTEAFTTQIRALEIPKVGVFVNERFELILQMAIVYDLQYVQLHGEESPELVRELSHYFKVIKAFSIDETFDFSTCKRYGYADLFLFDTKGQLAGGNGIHFNWELLQNYKGSQPFLISGGIGPEDVEVIKQLDHQKLVGVDINSRFEIEPGYKDLEKVNQFVRRLKRKERRKKEEGYYGIFGGAFIPELLRNSLEELKKAFNTARLDPKFEVEYKYALCDYVGRPTPLYFSEKLSTEYGAKIYLKREDLNHTGSHKINNTIGQILLAKRMGKTRIIAETGAGQHGVATATVCAKMGMECVVYMGQVDIERQRSNVQRMQMLGAHVISATSGSQTLKDATNEAIRDWISHPDSFYLIGSVVGPHPYPEMVAYFQSVISSEIKKQLFEKTGESLPDMIVACVGGGSNAAGAFMEYIETEEVELIVVEAAGKGVKSGKSAATSVLGTVGIIHGAKTILMQDNYGQIIEPYSISAGLDYPGIGPLHAHLILSGRSRAVSVTDQEALEAGVKLTQSEGIIPALESAHAIAALNKLPLKGKTVVLNLSGRGDKDLKTYLNY